MQNQTGMINIDWKEFLTEIMQYWMINIIMWIEPELTNEVEGFSTYFDAIEKPTSTL
jgi:hypothetical protein